MSSLKNIYAAAFVCAVRLNNDEEWQEQSKHCDLIFSKKKKKGSKEGETAKISDKMH